MLYICITRLKVPGCCISILPVRLFATVWTNCLRLHFYVYKAIYKYLYNAFLYK